jgi:UDP-N-acetylmuramate dehydrogenase
VKTKLELKEYEGLAPLTTLNIGGAARYFSRAETEEQVAEAVEFAAKNELKLFILGGGSNVLVSDDGFDGLVLQVALRGVSSEPPAVTGGLTRAVTAHAGEDWDEFVAHCVKNDLAGIENLSGIPGFLGGTPVQNVGAYGQEVAETIVSVRCFDRSTSEFVTLSNADCGFAYRTSIFNSTHRDRYIVLSVTFELKLGGEPKIEYKDLAERFGGRRPTLGEVRDAVLKIRRAKSMVIDTADPNSLSAGSFFKNPVIEIDRLDELRERFPDLPSFKFGDKVKIPAAWLIERAGFSKGFAMRRAGISANHTLALINRGGATADEMLGLMDAIQHAVNAKFGINLQPEPVFVGF